MEPGDWARKALEIIESETRDLVVFDGIKYQMNREGYQPTLADPKGPPKLLINYIADRDHPDVAKIEPGKF
jgi:hypothetical protein